MQNEKYTRFWCVYDNCTQTANADIPSSRNFFITSISILDSIESSDCFLRCFLLRSAAKWVSLFSELAEDHNVRSCLFF